MAQRRALRWLFFVVLFCLVPLPFQLMEPGFAPALRIVMLAGILGAITLADGFSEITKIMLPIALAQAVIYPLLLWWTCGRVLRVITERTSPAASAGFVAAVAALLLLLSSFEIYVTPLSSTGAHADLVHLLD